MRSLPVTVLMPVYNGAVHLREAVGSILGQTFTDFEFLIIDDGSTDGSGEILEDYARRDSRIQLVRRENRGLVATLNEGLNLARAPLVARMDADDVSLPQRLRLQVDYMRATPDVAAVGCAIRLIDPEGAPLSDVRYPTDPEQVALRMRDVCSLAHPAVVMRREFVAKAGGYRAVCRHAEDLDLWLRLLEHGARLANFDEVLLLYRQHGGSVTSRHALNQALAATAILEAARQRREGRPDPLEDLEPPLELERLLAAFDNSPRDGYLFRTRLLRHVLDAHPALDKDTARLVLELQGQSTRLAGHGERMDIRLPMLAALCSLRGRQWLAGARFLGSALSSDAPGVLRTGLDWLGRRLRRRRAGAQS